MIWAAILYAFVAVYFFGEFNGADSFRIRPTWRAGLENLGASIVWPLGVVMMFTPESWWKR